MRRRSTPTLVQVRDGLAAALPRHMYERCGTHVTVEIADRDLGLVVRHRDGSDLSAAERDVLETFMTGYVAGLGVARPAFPLSPVGELISPTPAAPLRVA